MRANLARHGRRLLIYQATSVPACLSYTSTARRRPIERAAVRRNFQRRSFLNALFQKPPREIRQPVYEPGWMQIMIWRSCVLDNLRPPRRRELARAWQTLMEFKLRRRIPLNSTQALQCRRLMEHMTLAPLPHQRASRPLTLDHLQTARRVLLEITPQERTENHVEFARALHAAWVSENPAVKETDAERPWAYLVKVLCEFGASEEAMHMLQSEWQKPAYFACLTEKDCLLESVARGLAGEDKESQLVTLVTYAMEHGVPYNAAIQSVMVEYFAKKDRLAETQRWLRQQPVDQSRPKARVYRTVASFARRNGLQEWAAPLFIELGQSQARPRHWNVILQSILLFGKSLGDVDAIMSHMVDGKGPVSPTIRTMNGLLTVALETQDCRLAGDILALGREKGISPDGETYLLLLQLRLEARDIAGAIEAYKQVRHHEPWNNGANPDVSDEFRRSSNKFLTLLSEQVPPDFKLILELLEAVEEEQILLEPETIAALSIKFLENDQNFDVMDMLSSHSFHYSEHQREVVQDAFIDYCLDASGTSTSRAWGAYQILQQYFQDTSPERRTKLMRAFFDRKRPDMAAHVVGHMRQHRNKSFHPTVETYVLYLEGVAQNPDLEGLVMIHNMLKMDTTVQPTTRLYNGLMLAYTGCGKPGTALDVWDEIERSPEGPSYASLEAVFWALETKPGGGKRAREIWDRIEKMDLEVPPGVYDGYVGAIAGSGNEKEVRGLVMNMGSCVGLEPSCMTLAIAHNALPGQELQANYREWAQKRYRGVWAELDKVGRRVDEYGLCQIKIKRVIKA